jgi:hypothetical protein
MKRASLAKTADFTRLSLAFFALHVHSGKCRHQYRNTHDCVMNNLAKYSILLLCCWLNVSISIAQNADVKKQVYLAYFSNAVFRYDSVYHKRIDNVVIAPLDNKMNKLNFDTEYLRDYLNGNLDANEIYRTYIRPEGQEPLSWLSYPWGIGRIINEDKQVGEMLIRLSDILPNSHQIPVLGGSDEKFILASNSFKQDWKKFDQKGGWVAFYKKHKHCYGVVELSDIIFSPDGERAAFYVQGYRGDLDGWGGVIFMKKTREGWEDDLALQFWVS